MNKKISFPIAIIIIVACAVLTGLLAWQYGLIPCKDPIGPLPKPLEKEVIITTDKTEYEQGETVKIIVKNNSDKPIWYNKETCPPFCVQLQKLENGEWINVSMAIMVVSDLPVRASLLQPTEEVVREWDMFIVKPVDEIITAESGKYRFSFYYGLSKDNHTEKTIYSNEFTIKEKDETIELPDEDLCEYADVGWFCILASLEEWEAERGEKDFEEIEKEFKGACEKQGGVWRCYGMCMPFYEHYCDFPFDDAGKECTNSGQCQGGCIVSMDYVEENYPDRELYKDIIVGPELKGNCVEYPLRECDWWFELNDGVITDHTGMLCD